MPTTTLRPDASSGTSTVVGAASAEAALNDNSDASYISNSSGAGVDVTLTFGTFALPGGAVVRSITPRIRVRTSVYALIETYLSINGANPQSQVFFPGTSFSTITGSAVPGGQSQADLNGLQMELRFAGTPPTNDVAELYLDVLYASIPTVAVTAPTGTLTLTNQPTVAWTYTAGADGGAQAAYQVRVFNAAQYGAAGFDPSWSTSEYNSGVVASSATSAIAGPLSSPTTLRAYVRAAQIVNGAYQWSDWAFSGFATNVVAPLISMVSATPDNTLARHRITVTRNLAGPNWTMVEVQWTVDGGVTWGPVRGATDVTPPGDVWIGYDYEAHNGVPTNYRARGKTSLLTGDWYIAGTSTWSSSATWLKDPTVTANSRTVRARILPDLSRGRNVSVLYPAGASAPVVVADVARLAQGTLEVSTLTAATAAALRTLLGGSTFMWQPPPSHGVAEMYIAVVGDVVEMRPLRPAQAAHRVWSIPFVEIARPPDAGLIVAGLTWQDMLDSYATWTAMNAAVATWGTLV